jgi:hypothetical protein
MPSCQLKLKSKAATMAATKHPNVKQMNTKPGVNISKIASTRPSTSQINQAGINQPSFKGIAEFNFYISKIKVIKKTRMRKKNSPAVERQFLKLW